MRKAKRLYPHQEEGRRRALNEPFFALFMDQGTGKTAVAITTTVERYKRDQVHRIVVFAPNNLLYNWTLEIADWAGLPPDQLKVLRLKGKGKENWAKQIASFLEYDPEFTSLSQLRGRGWKGTKKEYVRKSKSPLMILLLNYEKARILEPQLRRMKIQGLIIDESQRVKSRNAQVSKAIYRVTRKCDSRLLMSGTPMGKGYEDLFMQYKIMDPDIFGEDYRDFEERYIRKGGYMGKEIVGYQHVNELQRIVADTSYRVELDDCVELPDLSTRYLTCELTGEALKAYNELYEDLYTQIPLEATRGRLKAILRMNDIPYSPRETYLSLLVKAEPYLNVSSCELTVTKLIRLQQLTGGHLHLDSGELVPLGRAKLDLAIEYLRDRELPTVIFCNYVEEIRMLERELSKAFPKRKVVNYRDDRDKEKVQDQFQAGKIDILILQIHSGSTGLNLQRSNAVVFYSINRSADDYLQAISRIKRQGQTRAMEVVMLLCEDTVDEDIYEGTMAKLKLMKRLWKKS